MSRFFSSLLFVVVFVSDVAIFAATPAVRVGYPQPSGAMLPLWLVTDAKLDQKYSVPAQNIFISVAGRMTQSMVAVDIDLASIGCAVVNTVLASCDLVAISCHVPTYRLSRFSHPAAEDRASLHRQCVRIM